MLAAVSRELGGGRIEAGSELPGVVDVLTGAGVVSSRSAARRAIVEGGAYLNNQKVQDPEQVLGEDDLLAGGVVIVRRAVSYTHLDVYKRQVVIVTRAPNGGAAVAEAFLGLHGTSSTSSHSSSTSP